MENFKVVTISGHLIKINSKGAIFRLNGKGSWVLITNIALFELVSEEEIRDAAEGFNSVKMMKDLSNIFKK